MQRHRKGKLSNTQLKEKRKKKYLGGGGETDQSAKLHRVEQRVLAGVKGSLVQIYYRGGFTGQQRDGAGVESPRKLWEVPRQLC